MENQTIKLDDYTGFEVTGVDRRGSRFKKSYDNSTAGAMTAFGINLWNGSVWGILKSNGKRKRLRRVVN